MLGHREGFELPFLTAWWLERWNKPMPRRINLMESVRSGGSPFSEERFFSHAFHSGGRVERCGEMWSLLRPAGRRLHPPWCLHQHNDHCILPHCPVFQETENSIDLDNNDQRI